MTDVYRNLVELAAASVRQHADRPLFGERHDDGWYWVTYAQWQQHVDATRAGLAALGVRPGDRIAIVSRNSTAWAITAYASHGLGATFVPMYEGQRSDEWEFILGDCRASVVFVRTPAIAAAVAAMRERLPMLRHVVTIDADIDDPSSLAALERRGAPTPAIDVAPESIAELVYTSGTTGRPKGVMLTHRNLTSNIAATVAAFPLAHGDRTLSFLPWAHVYGQVCELHLLVAVGASTAFNTALERLMRDLGEVKPTILVAVPRIFNRIHSGVIAQLEKRPRAIRNVFHRGLAASIRRRRGERLELGERVSLALAAPLFRAIRNKLGGRLRYAVSGSATLSREVAEFVDGIGIEVYEGYGLTETSPIVALNRPGHRKLGSVGIPIEDVRIEIDRSQSNEPGEGELIVYGPNVMKGYHERPDENARAFTADGGLRTGDLGRIDSDGYLYITGRIKEQYKLENGKYVMPGPLEEQLTLSPFIKHVMLHGANQAYNVALVSIDGERVRKWADDNHVALAADPTRDPRVRALILDELSERAKGFRGFEKPRACVLTELPFTIENGLLTPTLKLKRREVYARFRNELDALYRGGPPPPEAVPAGEPVARQP